VAWRNNSLLRLRLERGEVLQVLNNGRAVGEQEVFSFITEATALLVNSLLLNATQASGDFGELGSRVRLELAFLQAEQVVIDVLVQVHLHEYLGALHPFLRDFG